MALGHLRTGGHLDQDAGGRCAGRTPVPGRPGVGELDRQVHGVSDAALQPVARDLEVGGVRGGHRHPTDVRVLVRGAEVGRGGVGQLRQLQGRAGALDGPRRGFVRRGVVVLGHHPVSYTHL